MLAADLLCPDLNSAVDWAVPRGHPLALPLTRALAIGIEHHGADVDSLSAVDRAARDPRIRQAASTDDLSFMGRALCFGDLDLVTDLGGLALRKASDGDAAAPAHYLAGLAAAYRRDADRALSHLRVAEGLAIDSGDAWLVASVRQARGVALRGQHRIDAALAAFASALEGFASVGDPIHVNTVRYMMASTAASAGRETERAVVWAQECAAYARRRGNRHELAHAQLTLALLHPGVPDADVEEATQAFRALGDLRCLTRGHLLLAKRAPAPNRVAHLETALAVAEQARDDAHRADALQELVVAHWESGNVREAAVALGRLTVLVGDDEVALRLPDRILRGLSDRTTSLAEGRAIGA